MQSFRLLRNCNRYASSVARSLLAVRRYSDAPSGMKVTLCGAAGNTGQPLAALLKQSPSVDEIALYDIYSTCGYGMELSHIDTRCRVCSYSGRHMLAEALMGSKVVVILARNECDSFENNAPIVIEIALQICNVCPSAFTIVATEPVESMVPLVEEVQRLRNTYDPKKLLGVVELNSVRANTVLAEFLKVPPETLRVPVVGGATPATMVPVLSRAMNTSLATQEQVECLTSSILGGDEAVRAAKRNPLGTPCFAGAYAIARTTLSVVNGLRGKKGVVQCAYVDHLNTCVPECQFFCTEVMLGPTGIEKNLGIPELTKFEHCLLCNALPSVQNEIKRAIYLVYTICTTHSYPICTCNPSNCFHIPMPCGFVRSGDKCCDEYLTKVCRDMTCTCGSTELVWSPRGIDYDAVRASNRAHQIPAKGNACSARLPRSIRMAEQIQQQMEPYNPNN